MKQLLTKYQFFTKLPQISLTKIVNANVLLERDIDQLLLPYKFYGRDIKIIYFKFLTVRALNNISLCQFLPLTDLTTKTKSFKGPPASPKVTAIMREKYDLQYQFYYFIKDKFEKLKSIV